MNEYKIVAARHHTTAISVERAIRYICDTQQEKLQKYFETDYKITNSVLYELLREKVLEEIDQFNMKQENLTNYVAM